MNKNDSTPVAEVNATPVEATTNTEATVEVKEETLGDALHQPEKKIPDSIPYNRFQEKVLTKKPLS